MEWCSLCRIDLLSVVVGRCCPHARARVFDFDVGFIQAGADGGRGVPGEHLPEQDTLRVLQEG